MGEVLDGHGSGAGQTVHVDGDPKRMERFVLAGAGLCAEQEQGNDAV
ncbi:hypothetical protein YTPLAS18_21860 [Nitrospira sp.]|nr:hypothetical protein YTPLAS18_21860 [Nitrospira sp.]